MEQLSAEDRKGALAKLADWTYDDSHKALYREIRLDDFSQAIALMVRIGIEAEKADHHPEWLNVYNRIEIWLTTHDADGVSIRDVALATRVDQLLRS